MTKFEITARSSGHLDVAAAPKPFPGSYPLFDRRRLRESDDCEWRTLTVPSIRITRCDRVSVRISIEIGAGSSPEVLPGKPPHQTWAVGPVQSQIQSAVWLMQHSGIAKVSGIAAGVLGQIAVWVVIVDRGADRRAALNGYDVSH
jgi:hypothetical protein